MNQLPRSRQTHIELIENASSNRNFRHSVPIEEAKGSDALKGVDKLRLHWPEYLMEAGELCFYMFVACTLTTLLKHPNSPVRHWIVNDLFRRALMGVTMGMTVIAIVLSPWGKQSGAHVNPIVTLTFYRLGKVELWDALYYILGQFLGAIAGVAIAHYVLRGALGNGAVRYAVTAPGAYGEPGAFIGEFVISFILMLTVLSVTNLKAIAQYTPYFAGTLVAIYITFEMPLSGMSANPARSFGSAFHANYWHALWIYFIAPGLGMMSAAEVFLRLHQGVPPICAKLHHANDKRCIFHCGYRAVQQSKSADLEIKAD